MGRPEGSQNKHKPFRAALNRLLDEAGPDPKRLDLIALALATKAQEGDVQAIKEIADRLDGKPAQALIGGDDDAPAIKADVTIRRIIVEPNGHQDGEGVSPATAAGEI